MSSEKLTNLDNLHDMANGDQEFMKEMVVIFLEDTPLYVKELEAAVKNNDWEGISRVSHKMKSSVRVFGVESLVDSLVALEFIEKEDNKAEVAKKHLSVVQEKVAASLEELKADFQI